MMARLFTSLREKCPNTEFFLVKYGVFSGYFSLSVSNNENYDHAS